VTLFAERAGLRDGAWLARSPPVTFLDMFRLRFIEVAPYAALALFVFSVHVLLALAVGAEGWDDGAITLAFARSFAETGTIGLTPNSETVEGFSSPFWFLLMAGFRALFHFPFHAYITAAQILAATFTTVTALISYLYIPRRNKGFATWLLVAALFVSAGFLNETVNGMEMSSLAAVAISICVVVDRRGDRVSWLLGALAFLAPLIRIEAAGYVIAGALGLLLFLRWRSAALTLAVGALASLVLTTLIRLVIFNAWLPNTITAKQWPPYSAVDTSERVRLSVRAFEESGVVLAPIVLFLLVGAVMSWTSLGPNVRAVISERKISPPVVFAASYLLAVVALNTAIGQNWGYEGRMQLSFVPLALVVTAAVIPWMDRRSVIAGTLAAVLTIIALAPRVLQRENFEAGLTGRHAGIVVSPEEYRRTGLDADRVRTLLGLNVLGFMTPDVGGSSLCCRTLRVIDVGLLANVELASAGYANLPAYLRRTKPDLIESHGVWSEVTNIYKLDYFRESYRPIIIQGSWYYLRNDHFEKIAEVCTPTRLAGTEHLRYRGIAVDEEYVASLHLKTVCRVPS
jgi:hypothetical protein